MSSLVDSGVLAKYYKTLGHYEESKENKEKIKDLLNWIDENKTDSDDFCHDIVNVDDFKKKIKELFDIL